jgi:hypothetical protein
MEQPPAPSPAVTIRFILDRLDRGKTLTGTELRTLRTCIAEMQPARTSLAADLNWAAARLRSIPTPEDEGVHDVWEIAANTLVEWAAAAQSRPFVEFFTPCVADSATNGVLAEVAAERIRQNEKWGEQNHPDGTGDPGTSDMANIMRGACQAAAARGQLTWNDVITEEIAEANAESDPTRLRAELVQIAAVAVAWAEAIDRRGGA